MTSLAFNSRLPEILASNPVGFDTIVSEPKQERRPQELKRRLSLDAGLNRNPDLSPRLASHNLLIEEMRIQAKNDLQVAREILDSGQPNSVAWAIEQSYEKIVSHAYSYYRIECGGFTAEQTYEVILKKVHRKKFLLVINMLRDLFGAFKATIADISSPEALSQKPERYGAMITEISDLIQPAKWAAINIKELDKSLQSIATEVDGVVSHPDLFKGYLDECTATELKASHRLDVDSVMKGVELLKGPIMTRLTDQRIAEVIKVEAFGKAEMYVKLYEFPVRALELAKWTLPHADTSRYPERELEYNNLRLYRERKEQLRDFYDSLIPRIDELFNLAEGFKASLDWLAAHGVNFESS